MSKDTKALVVLSGGADSTTCLAWAGQEFGEVHAITFHYGQRHDIEIEAALTVGRMLGVRSHEVLRLGPVLKGTSPLVSDNPVGHYGGADALPGGVEPTFVPARNILFLTLAANRAACLGTPHVVTGVCEEDFGGYPDCRRIFIDAMERALTLGVYGNNLTPDQLFQVHTPLMTLSKAKSVELALSLPGCMDALAYSHTCYDGCYPPCPNNHASILRAKGFRDYGVPDPLILRAKNEGLLPSDYPDTGYVEGTPYAGTGCVETEPDGRRWWNPIGPVTIS
jgi:7-cyano-7-deazaguanine synthase